MHTTSSENRASRVQPESRRNEIRSAQIRLLYANTNVGVAVTVLAATILGFLQWGIIPNSVLVGWWLYMILVSAFRGALAQRYRHAASGYIETIRWRTAFTVGAGLAGAGWGGAGILLYPEAHLTNQVFLVFVLGGMMLGAATVLAPRPEAFLAFLIPTGLGPVVRLLVEGDKTHLAMALLAALFTLATLITTGRIYRTIDSSLRLQFENRNLLEDLQADVTERRQAEEALRELSGRLLQTQDQERRRLAREFHDGTSQILASMQLHVALLQDLLPREDAAAQEALSELTDLAGRCGSEIRTLCHVLHPPILEENGLGPALRSYAEGFGQRSGITVTAEIPDELPRLNSDVETTLFRVTQETLANVHRHSGSKTAQIRVALIEGRIRLEITDHGHGIPAAVLRSPTKLGVGIRGMTERIRLLEGELSIESTELGTTVRAELPTAPPGSAHA